MIGLLKTQYLSKARDLLCSFLIVSIVACGFGGPPRHPKWANATGAEQYERLMWKAIRDGDWSNFEYHLAATFVGIDEQGRNFDRDNWVARWKADRIKDFSLTDVVVRPAGASMVVSYSLRLDGEKPRALRVLSVWQEVKGHWILIVTSDTPKS